jgi:hypothetical protein
MEVQILIVYDAMSIGERLPTFPRYFLVPSSVFSSVTYTLKMQAESSSEILVTTHQSARRHLGVHQHSCEKFKSPTL